MADNVSAAARILGTAKAHAKQEERVPTLDKWLARSFGSGEVQWGKIAAKDTIETDGNRVTFKLSRSAEKAILANGRVHKPGGMPLVFTTGLPEGISKVELAEKWASERFSVATYEMTLTLDV